MDSEHKICLCGAVNPKEYVYCDECGQVLKRKRPRINKSITQITKSPKLYPIQEEILTCPPDDGEGIEYKIT